MKTYSLTKAILGLTFCFFFSTQLLAQNTFFKTYDYSGNDVGNFVIGTIDGGYAIVGKTGPFWTGDVWLLKTDANGDTLWTKTYGGEQDDVGYCVRQTSDNGFIIAASKTVPEHYVDGWIIKTDSNGNLDWEYNFGGEYNGDYASYIVPSSNHTFVVSGVLGGQSYVFKIDEDGDIIWEHTYFSNNSSNTGAICQTSDNGYAVVGSFQISAGGAWYPNLFFINDAGELLTQITYMETGSANCIIEASDGGFIFGGSWNDSLQVKKISSTGIDLWEYTYQGEPLSTVTSIIEPSYGNILVSDNSSWARLRKLNLQGDTLWTRDSDINNESVRYANVQLTGDNGLIMTGLGKNDATDHEVILVKTNEEGSMTGINSYEISQSKVFLVNSPNPFVENTLLSFYLPEKETIELYISDLQGKNIKRLLNKPISSGIHEINWNGTDSNGNFCPTGIYLAILKTKDGKVFTKKLLKASK